MKKRRLQSIEQRLNAYIDKSGSCWLWTMNTYNYGYGKLSIGKGKQVRAHRYIYEQSKGKIPEGMMVLHTCDNPRCCNPEHLFLGNQKDNMVDAKEKGRIGYKAFFGDKHSNSKLTMEQVAEIKQLYLSGKYYQSELSKMFKVSQPVISKVILGQSYSRSGEQLITIKNKQQ